MSDTTVTLDGFDFRDFEVPSKMPFGGQQAHDIKKLGGGVRVVDAMGPDDDPIRWDGIFRGPEAVSRAKEIDAKRKAGKAVALTWGEFAFTVLIVEFRADYEFRSEIAYQITCEVISDDATAPASQGDIGVDQMVLSDMLEAQSLKALIADPPLTGLMGTLQSAVDKVGSFASAGQSIIASVLQPLADVQDRVQSLIGTAESVLGSVSTLGGIIPGGIGLDLSAGLLGQVSAMADSANLYDMQAYLGRMGRNVTNIGTSGSEFVVAGADLYALATRYYGDATEWTTIARANGLLDPIVSGLQTILIPPTASGAGGVLEA